MMRKFLLSLFLLSLFFVACKKKKEEPQPDTTTVADKSPLFKKYTIKNAQGNVTFQQECKYDDKARLTELLQTYNDQPRYRYELTYNQEGLLGTITVKNLPTNDLGVLSGGEETKYLYEYHGGLVSRVSIQPANTPPTLLYEYTYQGQNLKTMKAVYRGLLFEYDEYNAVGRPGIRRQYRVKNDSLLLIGKRIYTYDENNNLTTQNNLDSLTSQPLDRLFITTYNSDKQVGIGPLQLIPSADIIYGASENVNLNSRDRNKNLILTSRDLYKIGCAGSTAESYATGSILETSSHVFDAYNRLVSFRTTQTIYDYHYGDCTSTPGTTKEEYTTIEY